jgi:DNA primase large subunit
MENSENEKSIASKTAEERKSKLRDEYESFLWTTFCGEPSEEVREKRITIMRKLRDEEVVYKALKIIQDFFKEEGMESASINVQIFPEFCEKGHIIDDMWTKSNKGALYFVNADLNTTTGKDWYNLRPRLTN